MHLSPQVAQRWLSPHRFGVYLQATSGDRPAALDLYDWNATVAAACLRDIGHFEVLIRNRYAEQLNPHQADWTQSTSQLWVRENGMATTRQKQNAANRKSRQALDGALRLAPSPTPGHIIANLMFGFWAALSQPARESTIWTPILSGLFSGKSRGPIHDHMTKLNDFRNRLAHWEPVFSSTTGLALRLAEFDEIFRLVDQDVASWSGARSAVQKAVSECPVPGLNIVLPVYLGQPSTT